MFELTHDRGKAETRERPEQFFVGEHAAERDQPAEALVRAPVDILKGLSVGHAPIYAASAA